MERAERGRRFSIVVIAASVPRPDDGTADAVAEAKLVDPEGELVAAARVIKTSFGDGVSVT
jgi:hypothetical protein